MTLLRRVGLTIAVGLISSVGLVAVPSSGRAAGISTYLCTGYTACKQAGYSDSGYAANNDTMYWRMYAGHNCTNYVAYRLVKSGLPNERPWSGSGNATNWGVAMKDITDSTPMVGAVAWWRANTPGAGSSGHVAIVERVVSATEIIISEDMWGGDFHWRRITADSDRWPAGFIHFNDRPLAAVTRPSIEGDPVVGETLTADTGTWAQSGATYAVQWYAGSQAIPGATATTLEVTPELVDQALRVKVTATRTGYRPGTAKSTRSPAVRPGTLAVATQPSIIGTPRVGEVLTLDEASWSPTPSTTSVRWLADGRPIDGATGASLELTPELVDRRISVEQTASSPGYTTSDLSSEPTAKVRPGRILVEEPFTLRGATRVGRTLSVQPGTVTPADADVAYLWTRDGKPIAGATASSYTLTADDVGHQVDVALDLSRRGYQDLGVPLTTPGPVTTTPVLKLASRATDSAKVVVRLLVTAEGVRTATGKVQAWIGSHLVEGELTDGRVRLVITDLPPGQRTLHVSYAGTSVIEGGHVATRVVVPKPPKKRD